MTDYVVRNGIPPGLASVVEAEVPAGAWTSSSYQLTATPDRPLSIVFARTDAEKGSANVTVTIKASLYELASYTTSVTLHALAGGLLSKSRHFSNLKAGVSINTDSPPEGHRRFAFSVYQLFGEKKPKPLPPIHLWITFVRGTAFTATISGSTTAGTSSSPFQQEGSCSFGHYITSENPHDVKFIAQGRELWASKRTLADASEHWAAMFFGSWAEEHAPGGTADGSSAEAVELPELETKASSTRKPVPQGAPAQDTATVQCPGFSYNCVKAMLFYLLNGEVTFSIPLPPSIGATGEANVGPPTAEPAPRHSDAVSAHDLYEVAHFYILPALQELCVRHVRRCLDVETVAFQLLSPSMRFAELREAVCQYIVDNYAMVEMTSAWAHVHHQLEDGEDPEGTAAAVSALACLARLRVKQHKETQQA